MFNWLYGYSHTNIFHSFALVINLTMFQSNMAIFRYIIYAVKYKVGDALKRNLENNSSNNNKTTPTFQL
jgi:hypothetical protein